MLASNDRFSADVLHNVLENVTKLSGDVCV